MTLSLTTDARLENVRPLRNLAAELACSAGLPDDCEAWGLVASGRTPKWCLDASLREG